MNIFISILIILNFSYADYAGGYSGSSMRLGSSAREISLSNSLVSVSNPGFNAFVNPALVSLTKGTQIGSSLFLLSNNKNLQAFSFCRELPPSAGAAISFFRAGVNNIVGISSSEQNLGELGYSDGFAMLSFGLKFGNYFSTGLNVKALFQRFVISDNEKYSAQGIALDLGFYTSPINNLDLGIKIENLSGKYNWNHGISEESQDYEEKIPLRGLLGTSYSLSNVFTLILQHEVIFISSFNSNRSSMSMEYTVNSKTPIYLRFGLKQNQWAIIENDKSDFPFTLCSGIGFSQLNFINKLQLNIDYAFQYTNLGFNNYFSISTQL